MIVLQPFSESDFARLLAEIPDARFLLQWAGPKYTFPLDTAQLRATLTHTNGENLSSQVFKAIRSVSSETVGHIQLMEIDNVAGHCVLGRVLVFQDFRGKGFGNPMVQAALTFAFEKLSLSEVSLGVFDFNTPAIKTYKRLGFLECDFIENARQFNNESWNVVKMKLRR